MPIDNRIAANLSKETAEQIVEYSKELIQRAAQIRKASEQATDDAQRLLDATKPSTA